MRSHRRPFVFVALAVAAAVTALALPATAVPPTETFATFGSISEGALDGTAFTVAGCGSASLTTSDLSGPEFVPAGSNAQATNTCTTGTAITTVFEAPLDGLDVYLVDLPYGHCVDGVYTITTDASGPVTIASGFDASTVSGSTLTVPYDSQNSGVLHLAGPVTSVVMTAAFGTYTATVTYGTVHVEPTTTTTSVAAPGADVDAAGAEAAGEAVAPTFTC